MQFKHKAGNSGDKYKRKKNILLAITAVLLLMISAEIILLALNDRKHTPKHINVAVCGAVNKSGVFSMPVNSDIGELIVKAKGISPKADLRDVDIEKILRKDSVYIIPYRKNNKEVMRAEVIDGMPALEITGNSKKDECINFLYIGSSAFYFLINYNTKTNKTLVTYIPHSSLFLDNEYRIVDVYLTFGRNYAMDLLQKSLGIKIDYFFVQDRSSFIHMVDDLDGIEVEIDKWFADEYRMKPGRHRLNGFQSFEYARYIQKKTKRTIFKAGNLELAYNLRQSRIKQVIKALLIKFKKSSIKGKLSAMASLILGNSAETNINIKAINKLIKQIVDNPELSFETIKGYYVKKNNNLYYIPTEWNYKNLKRKALLDDFDVIKAKEKQVLY